MRWPVLIVLALGAAPAEVAPEAGTETSFGWQGVVVADNSDAAQTGTNVLQEGGNAFDAAVAVALRLGVVSPQSSGLGGGGFALFRTPDGAVRSLDFRETAPSFLAADAYQDASHDSRTGAWAVGVPGEVAGLWALHQAGGQLPWAEVVEMARSPRGFKVGSALAKALAAHRDEILADPGLREQFTKNGVVLEEGDQCVRTALDATLVRLRDEGPAGFYGGETAASLAGFLAAQGAPWTTEELALYEVVERPTVSGAYGGLTVHSMGPPSSGGIAILETLALLEAAGHREMEPQGPEWTRTLVQALSHAFADRAAYGGDPGFVQIPVADLLDPSLPARLWERTPAEGPLATAEAGLAGINGDLPVSLPDDQGTSHFSIMDAWGNTVALTTTINLEFGAKIADPGTGIILNNQMDDFTARPGMPNAFGLVQGVANAPGAGKRPLSSMAPTIVLDAKGVVVAALGASGGPRIITATLQALLGLVDGGLDPVDAVMASRLHHQWLPGGVLFEEGYPAESQEALAAEGFLVGPLANHGIVQLATFDPEAEGWGRPGAADLRKDPEVIVYLAWGPV